MKLIYLLKNLILFPIKLIKKIIEIIKSFFKKDNKKTPIGDFESDIKKIIALNLPINVVSVHFDEENGLRYDITSTQQNKAKERAKNEEEKRDLEEGKKEKATTAKSKRTSTTKKKDSNTTTKKKRASSAAAKSEE